MDNNIPRQNIKIGNENVLYKDTQNLEPKLGRSEPNGVVRWIKHKYYKAANEDWKKGNVLDQASEDQPLHTRHITQPSLSATKPDFQKYLADVRKSIGMSLPTLDDDFIRTYEVNYLLPPDVPNAQSECAWIHKQLAALFEALQRLDAIQVSVGGTEPSQVPATPSPKGGLIQDTPLLSAKTNPIEQNKDELLTAIENLSTRLKLLEAFIHNDPCSSHAITYSINMMAAATLLFLENEHKHLLHQYRNSLSPQEAYDNCAKDLIEATHRVNIALAEAKYQSENGGGAKGTTAIGIAKDLMQQAVHFGYLARKYNRHTLAHELKKSQVCLLNANQTWNTIVRTLHIDGQHSFQSVITPAKRLGNIMEASYQGIGGISSHSITERKHAVNLCRTELFHTQTHDPQKLQLVFHALRHGVHCAYGIDDTVARKEANFQRALETIQAVVVSDPHLLAAARATVGTDNQVAFNMLSINLQTPDEMRDVFKVFSGKAYDEKLQILEQKEAWDVVSGKTSRQGQMWEGVIPILDEKGEAQLVSIKPNVAMVNFGVNRFSLEGLGPWSQHTQWIGGWETVKAMNQEAMVWLFGPQQIQEHTGSIEGLVGDYLLQLRNRINRLQTNLAELNPQSLEHQETHNQMAELQLQHERILVLSHQVLSIFLNENYKTTGNEPYKIVARLAILCNWIGVQVAFNCKSGKDRTGMLDSEIKFLIARICQEGIIPEPDAMLSAEQSNMLFNFCINSGSHEVQELNTGIRGYKQDNSQTPKRLGGASISRYVRGPSEFVAN